MGICFSTKPDLDDRMLLKYNEALARKDLDTATAILKTWNDTKYKYNTNAQAVIDVMFKDLNLAQPARPPPQTQAEEIRATVTELVQTADAVLDAAGAVSGTVVKAGQTIDQMQKSQDELKGLIQ
jgi:ketosteroid isomerase-like protein